MRRAKPFHNGRLAHAWLPDEHRVVLGSAGEHLDYPANFFVPSDHRIQFASPGQLRQVFGVAVKGLVLAFGVLIGDPSDCRERKSSACRIASRVAPIRGQQLLRRVLLDLR